MTLLASAGTAVTSVKVKQLSLADIDILRAAISSMSMSILEHFSRTVLKSVCRQESAAYELDTWLSSFITASMSRESLAKLNASGVTSGTLVKSAATNLGHWLPTSLNLFIISVQSFVALSIL